MTLRLREVVHSVGALTTPAYGRSVAVVSGLVLVERLLTPLSAWWLLRGEGWARLGVPLGLAATFTVRSFAQRLVVVRTEAELFERVVATLLDGDVLQTSLLPGRDARTELVDAIFRSVPCLAQDVPNLVADAIASVVLMAAILVVEPPRLVLLVGALAAIGVLGVAWTRSRVQLATDRVWVAQEAVLQGFVDALEGRLELVAAAREGAVLEDLRGRARTWRRAGARAASSTVVSGRLPTLAIAALVSLLVATSWRKSGPWTVTMSDLALLASVTPAFAGVAQGLFGLARGEHWMALVTQALSLPRRPSPGPLAPPQTPSSIELRGFSYAYPAARSRPAVNGVHISWRRGQVLGLAGTNGSGKSTCLRAMLGLAIPSIGEVRIDGLDLMTIDVLAWRRAVTFLPQHPYMPQTASVSSAMRFLAPRATDAQLLDALARVGLLAPLQLRHADLLAVPVETLSVGQRQRVALARVLCRPATVYLLDEPDANLDPDGIAMCASLVRELSSHAMVAVAAHTAAVLGAADVVVAFHEGQVAPPAHSSS